MCISVQSLFFLSLQMSLCLPRFFTSHWPEQKTEISGGCVSLAPCSVYKLCLPSPVHVSAVWALAASSACTLPSAEPPRRQMDCWISCISISVAWCSQKEEATSAPRLKVSDSESLRETVIVMRFPLSQIVLVRDLWLKVLSAPSFQSVFTVKHVTNCSMALKSSFLWTVCRCLLQFWWQQKTLNPIIYSFPNRLGGSWCIALTNMLVCS